MYNRAIDQAIARADNGVRFYGRASLLGDNIRDIVHGVCLNNNIEINVFNQRFIDHVINLIRQRHGINEFQHNFVGFHEKRGS